MKKLRAIIAAALVPLLLAGCTMKTEYGMSINKDKEVTLELVMAYDKEMIDGIINMDNLDGSSDSAEITDAQRWAYVEKNMKESDEATWNEDTTKKKYEKDGWYGYTYSKKLGKIDKITETSAKAKNNILKADFDGTPSFIKKGNKYVSNMTIKDEDNSLSQMNQYKSYGAIFDLSLTITLPVKPISNNATTVSTDGKTLTWDLTKEQDIEFEFEFAKEKSSDDEDDKDLTKKIIIISAIAGSILGFLFLAVIFAIIIIVVVKKNKNKKAE